MKEEKGKTKAKEFISALEGCFDLCNCRLAVERHASKCLALVYLKCHSDFRSPFKEETTITEGVPRPKGFE